MFAPDFVLLGIGPFVRAEFRKTEFLHRAREPHRHARTFEFRDNIRSRCVRPQIRQHLRAIVPDAGDETQPGDDDAARLRMGRHDAGLYAAGPGDPLPMSPS